MLRVQRKALLTILLKDPLLEREEYPTEEVGTVDSLEEEVMAEISPGEMEEDLPTYHHAMDQADRLAPPALQDRQVQQDLPDLQLPHDPHQKIPLSSRRRSSGT